MKDYLAKIKEIPKLSKEEEVKLGREIKSGSEEARIKLCNSHLRLVAKITKDYGWRSNNFSFEDMFQEGIIGLLTAADKFDPEMDNRFSSYAQFFVKRDISRKISNYDRIIKISYKELTKYYHLKKHFNKYEIKHGNDPENALIYAAKKIEISLQEARKLFNLIYCSKTITSYHQNSKLNLENIVFGDLSKEIIDNIEKNKFQDKFYDKFEYLLSSLSDIERDIIINYFGFYDSEPMILREIAKKYSVTRQAIEQKKNRALKKIRTKINKDKKLKKYFEDYLMNYNNENIKI